MAYKSQVAKNVKIGILSRDILKFFFIPSPLVGTMSFHMEFFLEGIPYRLIEFTYHRTFFHQKVLY